jgi:hypothetical protein
MKTGYGTVYQKFNFVRVPPNLDLPYHPCMIPVPAYQYLTKDGVHTSYIFTKSKK